MGKYLVALFLVDSISDQGLVTFIAAWCHVTDMYPVDFGVENVA